MLQDVCQETKAGKGISYPERPCICITSGLNDCDCQDLLYFALRLILASQSASDRKLVSSSKHRDFAEQGFRFLLRHELHCWRTTELFARPSEFRNFGRIAVMDHSSSVLNGPLHHLYVLLLDGSAYAAVRNVNHEPQVETSSLFPIHAVPAGAAPPIWLSTSPPPPILCDRLVGGSPSRSRLRGGYKPLTCWMRERASQVCTSPHHVASWYGPPLSLVSAR